MQLIILCGYSELKKIGHDFIVSAAAQSGPLTVW